MVYGEFFPTRLEIFYCLVRNYVNSLTLNLKQRRERGSHAYRQLCPFLFNFGWRCIRAANLPAVADPQGNRNLFIRDVKALSIPDFLTCSKLDTRLDVTCMAVEGRSCERKAHEKATTLKELVAKNKEEIGRTSRIHVSRLFKVTQGLNRLTLSWNLILDLDIMLVDPVERATYCFKQLFTSFRLLRWFPSDNESPYTREYLSFLNLLRQTHPVF